MLNPEVKKGDRVILKRGMNNNNHFEGIVLEVTHIYNERNFAGQGYFSAKAADGLPMGTVTIYNNGNKDEYVLASRESQAKYCRNKIKELKREIIKLDREAIRLEKFEDDAEEVAHKLSQLLSKKNDTKAMAEVLRELKRTDFI